MPRRAMLSFVYGAILTIAHPAFADDLVLKGRQLVQTNCSSCHARDAASNGPYGAAPKFSDVADRYTEDELIDAFMEGLPVRHEAMPEWEMTLDQAEAIAAYIFSIK
jgi:cytochrome c